MLQYTKFQVPFRAKATSVTQLGNAYTLSAPTNVPERSLITNDRHHCYLLKPMNAYTCGEY